MTGLGHRSSYCEAAMAEKLPLDPRTRTLIDHDLAASAMEGLTEKQKVKVRNVPLGLPTASCVNAMGPGDYSAMTAAPTRLRR